MVDLPSFNLLDEWVTRTHPAVYERRPKDLVIRARHPDGYAVDYTLPRDESGYADNRRPDTVRVATVHEDLARRDFTVNALAAEVLPDGGMGPLLDLHGGEADLKKKVLRTVGAAYKRLAEDHLRIVRAMRFIVTKDFVPDRELERILLDGSFANKLLTLPTERIQGELLRMFSFSTPATLNFLRNVHPAYTDVMFDRGLWLMPTKARSSRKPPQ
jgi:tRNA nucleotidyltransferase/poly(A) polymerase